MGKIRVMLLLLLAGCSSVPQERHSMQRNGIESGLDDAVLEAANGRVGVLRQLAKEALQLGDADMIWRCNLPLCQYESTQQERHLACQRALDSAVAQQDTGAAFIVALSGYVHTQRSVWLHKAQHYSQSPLQQQYLLLAQQNWRALDGLKSELPDSLLAQFYYLKGRALQDISLLEQAQQLFVQTGQPRRQADATFARAMLLRAEGNNTGALKLAARATLMLEGAGEHDKAAYVRKWIDDWAIAR